MCLMVWIAAEAPLASVAPETPLTPDPLHGYHRVEDVASSAPVRARFSLPHVHYVGSHEGCGCGYNSGDLASGGFERVDEVRAYLDAMRDDEREAFSSAQRSRARLRAIVEEALTQVAVEVFGCWAGDEAESERRVEAVAPSHFTERLEPIAERVRYRVVGG